MSDFSTNIPVICLESETFKSLVKELANAVEGLELPFFEGCIAGAEGCEKERIQAKTVAKLREASKA